MPILLGAIADDFTGATDLCNTLVKEGMRTVQTIGVPPAGLAIPEADAVVVALKSRTCPPGEAVALSLEALAWLRAAGARQILFKYCSTFDSTEKGNIGPVGDALLEALDAGLTIACPAFPETGRTIYRGHLFVGDALLSDTHMRDHPLTPMRDSNLVRLLARQSRHEVGLVRWDTIARGAAAVRARLAEIAKSGCRYAITDALEDEHLRTLGAACSELKLITGGSGIALGLPANFRAAGLLRGGGSPDALPAVEGLSAVLSGSCSAATRGQVAAMAKRRPARKLDPLAEPAPQVEEALAWAEGRLREGPGADLRDGVAGGGAGGPAPARHGARGEPGGGHDGGDRRRPGRARRAPAGGGGWGDLGRRGPGIAGAGLADRAADRPRRAVHGDRRRAAAGPGAEVRQFRRRGLLH